MPNTGGRVQRTDGYHMGFRRDGNTVIVQLEKTASHLTSRSVGYSILGRRAWKANPGLALQFIEKFNTKGFEGCDTVEIAPVNPGEECFMCGDMKFDMAWYEDGSRMCRSCHS